MTSNAVVAKVGIALIIAIGAMTGRTASAEPTTFGLGTALSFALLSGAGITKAGPTTIAGDVGTSPTTTLTSFGSVTLTGAGAVAGVQTLPSTSTVDGPLSPLLMLGVVLAGIGVALLGRPVRHP
jgi:hypothetical protein